ncbi:MAG: lysophospholipase [Ruminococcus sp.]|nr:lysophospholipase [Ruminococcus sp.]
MKKTIKKFMISAMFVLVTMSSYLLCDDINSNVFAEIDANPVISTGCPAYSQTGMTSYANDEHYFSFWNSSGADYLAYDLSGVPENQRKKVIAVWYNATGQFDYTVANGGSNGLPSDYTIEVNSADGGDYPQDNWEVVEIVTGNTLHSRQHVVDMTGYNWIRMNISGNDGKDGGNTSVNMDIHNISDGISDSWIFYGDSITACGMMNCYGTGFAELVNQIDNRYFPIQENGGIGGITSTQGAENIDRWLEVFPGKYVSVAYGTNDAWGNPSNTEKYYSNTAYMVEKIIEAGKIPVVPKIPYATESAVGDNVPAYNAMIEKIYENYPEVVKGPDFETFFRENPDLLSADGVHPSDNGYAAMRELWADVMYKTVYSAESGNETLVGDVNKDGEISVADLVMMQNFLLGKGNLDDWSAGDIFKDDKINVFDMVMLRQLVVSQTGTK